MTQTTTAQTTTPMTQTTLTQMSISTYLHPARLRIYTTCKQLVRTWHFVVEAIIIELPALIKGYLPNFEGLRGRVLSFL